MLIFQGFLAYSPAQLRVRCPRQDEAVQDQIGILQACFNLLDPVAEQDLVAGLAFVQESVRLDESHELLVPNNHPQDEVRMEAAGLEEPDAFATAHVAQQVQLDAFSIQSLLITLSPALQIGDELVLALVEGHGQDSDLAALAEVEQRLEEVRSEQAGVQIAH